ncbi:MAG: aminopeptidase [Tissierellales bacterium]|jgi:aspartyl aminopeptidase|nr:aminopeptidase [Tissierellales bacterium]
MADKKSEAKKLQEKLTHKWKNVWEEVDEKGKKEIFEVSERYKTFLDVGKTERETAREIVKQAIADGYVSLDEVIKKGSVKTGDKIYATNKDKGVAMFIIGKEPITSGMKIVGSHIDVPRLDLKPSPLYEDTDLAFLKTHYYGGVKKYHWVAIPLALHGVVVTKDGERKDIVIGEDENDPVFMINDLLIHLSKDQLAKKMAEGITGEGLNMLVGSIPYADNEISEKVKLNVLSILNEKYGIVEEDFVTAEFEVVPAGKARDIGFDRSLVGAHGHDDRVCAYATLEAMLDMKGSEKTAVGLYVDKEEVGSQGNTGMQSRFFEYAVSEILALQEDYSELKLKRAMANSKVLSADVGAALNPNFPEVMEKRNAANLGKGVVLVKYTGARGKSGCNDANAEFISEVRHLFNDQGIVWQTGELGKIDQGGGGTIAYILANYGMEVVDCGVAVMGMHAPYEVVSKADVYMTKKAYKAFMETK